MVAINEFLGRGGIGACWARCALPNLHEVCFDQPTELIEKRELQNRQDPFITRGVACLGHKLFHLAKEPLLHFLFIDHEGHNYEENSYEK